MFFLASNIFAQQSLNYSFNNGFDDWDYDFWDSDSRPLIEVQYGSGEPKHENFNNEFNDVGLIELKLGNSSIDYYYHDIIELNASYLTVSQLSHDLKDSEKNALKVNSKLLRIGIGIRSGYGYGNDAFTVLPYYSQNFMIAKMSGTNLPDIRTFISDENYEIDNEILGRYNDAFRYAFSNEGGLKLELSKFIALNGGYEYMVVYPRFMTWKLLGSMAVEMSVLSALDNFVDEIIDRSPLAGPIVNFVLKNAYSYAFYTLRKEDMNWPFDSETPLTYETFKVGFSFTF
jgi:hypothetical protein